MLKIKPPDYKFCPFCSRRLQTRPYEGHKIKFCPVCRWTYYPHVAASVAAVIIKNGQALMVQRKREPYKSTWMFPAGFIEFGEHPLETLAREVKEETGLKVKKAILIKIFQSDDDPRSLGHFMLFYKVTTLGVKIKTDQEENIGIAWFDLKKPPEIGWHAHQQILKLLQKAT